VLYGWQHERQIQNRRIPDNTNLNLLQVEIELLKFGSLAWWHG
jgi:hypothetical protein